MNYKGELLPHQQAVTSEFYRAITDAGKHSETLENQSLGLANARTNGQLTLLV